jgi:hypothetical protein
MSIKRMQSDQVTRYARALAADAKRYAQVPGKLFHSQFQALTLYLIKMQKFSM